MRLSPQQQQQQQQELVAQEEEEEEVDCLDFFDLFNPLLFQ